MSVEQLSKPTITAEVPTPEVPLIFDVLDAVRGADDKVQAMQTIDMSGSLVFEDVLATMATIREESQADDTDYRIHNEYAHYLRQRLSLDQHRRLAANVEMAANVHSGLADFYAGRVPEVEQVGAGQRIINAAHNKYTELKTGATDKFTQAKESLTNLSPRVRRVGSVAVAAAILSGTLIPHGGHSEVRNVRPVVAQQIEAVPITEPQPTAPAAVVPQEPQYKEITVKPGDILSRLAPNNGSDTQTVFNSNRNILDDPNVILPGQVLKIPIGKIVLAEIAQAQEVAASQPVVVPKTTVANPPATIASQPLETKQVAAETVVANTRESYAGISFDKIPNINGVDNELIKDVMAYLIHQQHLTPTGAAYLAGNFITESGLDPQAPGGGLAQWGGSRLKGMPTDLYGAIDFALNTEMDRDGMASDLDELLRDPNATQAQIQDGLQRWERWGIQGRRFEFARTILAAIQES